MSEARGSEAEKTSKTPVWLSPSANAPVVLATLGGRREKLVNGGKFLPTTVADLTHIPAIGPIPRRRWPAGMLYKEAVVEN